MLVRSWSGVKFVTKLQSYMHNGYRIDRIWTVKWWWLFTEYLAVISRKPVLDELKIDIGPVSDK